MADDKEKQPEAKADGKPKTKVEPEAKADGKPKLFVDDQVEGPMLPATGIAAIRTKDPRLSGYFVLGRLVPNMHVVEGDTVRPDPKARPMRVNLAALTDEQRRDLPLDRCIEIKVEG